MGILLEVLKVPRTRVQVVCPKCEKTRGVLPYNLKRMDSMMCNMCAISKKIEGCNKTEHPLYEVWRSMNRRCHDQNNQQYLRYGARGIYVCGAWRRDFEAFVEWARGAGYGKGLQLDRTDNDSGYSPENCRFVSAMKNANNRRDNVKYSVCGETKTLSEWARSCGITPAAIRARIKKGHPVEKAVVAKRGECS
jgi:hypothetical protein